MKSYSDLFEAAINLLVGLFAITMCGLSHLLNRIDDFSLPLAKSSSVTSNSYHRAPRRGQQGQQGLERRRNYNNNVQQQYQRIRNIRYEEPEVPARAPVDEERVAASRRL